MFGFDPLKSRIARSILYLSTIGGLFFIIALAVSGAWNYAVSPAFNLSSINILESAGMVSVLYILLFSFKYARKDNPSTIKIKKMKTCAAISEEEIFEYRLSIAFKRMSKKDKEKLLNSVTRCCGSFYADNEIHESSKEYMKFHN